jgi:hypothetical protein
MSPGSCWIVCYDEAKCSYTLIVRSGYFVPVPALFSGGICMHMYYFLDKNFSLACIAEKIIFPTKLPKIPEVQKLITRQDLDGVILETSRYVNILVWKVCQV